MSDEATVSNIRPFGYEVCKRCGGIILDWSDPVGVVYPATTRVCPPDCGKAPSDEGGTGD